MKHATVRPPGRNFADGLTQADLGPPDHIKALSQHAAYCVALQQVGLTLNVLPPDEVHPDSTFVEDTAVIAENCAIVTRPGAESRRGEVAAIAQSLKSFFPQLYSIEAPGTVDGGDICQADRHFFIGLSNRTNKSGAEQLAAILKAQDYTCSYIDLTNSNDLLHLKSGLAYLGDRRLVVSEALADKQSFKDYELVTVDLDETYGANCLRINDHVLLAEGFPKVREKIQRLNYKTILLDMSEYRKMDGGLSCLSLRF